MMTRDDLKRLTWQITPQNGERMRYMAITARPPLVSGLRVQEQDPLFECEQFRCSLSMMREIPGLIEFGFEALEEIERLKAEIARLLGER